MINALDLDYKRLKRTRRVNGERVIELTVFPTEENKNYFDLLVEEAIVTFDSDEYVIKKIEEKSIGNTYFKQVTAIHKFYVDLINKQQYDVHNGSITFNNYMRMVFEDTPYANFETIDNFPAREFENLGDDNRLALLQKGLDRFKAEMELVGSGYKPRFRKMIGRDTDFQFRFGHNIKAISRDIDTTNLATYIRGYGDPELDVFAEYTSPNVAIFGKLDAPTVRDERFKSNNAMLEEIKSRLQDEPLVSITIDFVDLRSAGYPYTIPNEGDRIWLIYEPMDDLMIETRILEINETFDSQGKVIETEVTLSNHKKSFANTVFDNVRKQLNDIVDDDGIIRYNVLDDAVKIATEALQSAQTQLEFNNGLIAREKDDPNRLVVFNSAGIGISKDGGQTFTEAITADGFVLTAGAVGRLGANHIQIGPATIWDENFSEPESENLAIGTDEPKTQDDLIFGYLYTLKITPDDIELGDEFELSFTGSVYKETVIGIATNGFNPTVDDYIADPIPIPEMEGNITTQTITVTNIPDGNTLFIVIDNPLEAEFYIENLKLTRKNVQTVSNWVDGRFDDRFYNDLRLTSPLPTSITMNQDGITSYTTHDPNAYARLDHRGLYIRNGAIQIDGDFGAPVMQGFNDISNQVKISAAGLTTYEAGLRTSLLNGAGHHFYWQNTYIGKIGTNNWVGDTSYRGLVFDLENEANYMTWAFKQNPSDTIYTTMLAWHKTSAKTEKGFTFYDNVRITDDLKLTYLRTDSSSSRLVSLKNGTFDGVDGVWLKRDANRDSNGAGIFMSGARVLIGTPMSSGSNIYNVLDVTRNYVRAIQIWNQTSSSAANVVVGQSNGSLMRSTSASKYKLLIENEEEKGYDFRKILDLNVSSWYDKYATESYAEILNGNLSEEDVETLPIKRHFGLIAEDVYNVGLTEFVTFGKDGEVEGIEYDRLWTLLIPITRDHEDKLNEYDKRFGTIENRIDKLEQEIEKLKGAV